MPAEGSAIHCSCASCKAARALRGRAPDRLWHAEHQAILAVEGGQASCSLVGTHSAGSEHGSVREYLALRVSLCCTDPLFALAIPRQINLFLRVVRRREDGYHDLASLFHVRLAPSCKQLSTMCLRSTACFVAANWCTLPSAPVS